MNGCMDKYEEIKDSVISLQQQMHELEKRDNDVYRAIFEAAPIPDSVRSKDDRNETGS